MTVPFDPALVPTGAVLVLYKTNAARTAWEVVSGATQRGHTLTGAVTGFSFAVVAPQPPEGFPELTEKEWEIKGYKYARTDQIWDDLDSGVQTGGELKVLLRLGDNLPIHPDDQGDPPTARLETYSSYSGKTFWTLVQAPHFNPDGLDHPDTSYVYLNQTYTFKVRDPNASLKFLVNKGILDVADAGGNPLDLATCPWLDPSQPEQALKLACADEAIETLNVIRVNAHAVLSPFDFYEKAGFMLMTGAAGRWRFASGTTGDETLFHNDDFNIVYDAGGAGNGNHAYAELTTPKTIAIPLSTLHVDDLFNVVVFMSSYSKNLIQGESYALAFLRDPVDFATGLTFEMSGLEQLPVNHDPMPAPVPAPCPAADPAAGQLAFGSAEYPVTEDPLGARIEVRRTGGTHGEVAVQLETVDSTALAGADYVPQHVVVHFGDGEGGSRFVSILPVDDRVAEPDETLQLVLTTFSGCATLGSPATATLTIQDDDRPVPPPPTYTIGGTVTGLVGSGLRLKNLTNGEGLNVAATSFTMPTAVLDGGKYNVVVELQPSGPLQTCTVANGSGRVAGANVTGIAVTCDAPPPSGGLDLTFGDNGRVATTVPYQPTLLGARVGMALQGDGKILLVGGLTLLRLNGDGTLDGSFGVGGVVNVTLNGGVFDTAMDVAVQADGKILVAGTTSTAAVGSDDFAITRYDGRGNLDATFGTGGHVITDFFGSTDQVRRMMLQADGKILVVGSTIHPISVSSGATLFATARYGADGMLDTSFSRDGRSSDSPAQEVSVANGLTIQPDGDIVVVGGTRASGGDDPDLGMVRYVGDGQLAEPGSLDETFGPLKNGVLQAPLGAYDEGVDAVILGDGAILVTVNVDAGVTAGGRARGFGLARIPASGIPPPRFPAILTFTTESDVPRCMLKQSDGKIVVAGQAGALGANPDMAILRLDDTASHFDESFGVAGKLTVDFGARDSAESIVQQPDGKLLVAGYARRGSLNVFAVVRLMP